MKKILLSLLLAGGVQNSFAMQGVGGDAKNNGYFKFLTTIPQFAFNTLKDHPRAFAATSFVASACAAYYLYNKLDKSGVTPLMLAASNGISSIARALFCVCDVN